MRTRFIHRKRRVRHELHELTRISAERKEVKDFLSLWRRLGSSVALNVSRTLAFIRENSCNSCLILFLLLLQTLTADAHIGSPNVIFEGDARLYPVRVVVRPPDVVPGLAEISIRLEGETAENINSISVLPVFWRAGRKGAPPPDIATRVRGETNLYTASLWLMQGGAYSVDVTIDGKRGRGTLSVPVNSVATNTRPMATWYGIMLAGLGLLLFFSALQIARAAFSQSLLAPGAAATSRDQRRGYIAMAVTALIALTLVMGGKKWWDHEDNLYRKRILYRPLPIAASVRTERDEHILELRIDDAEGRDWMSLIPDHGKMMHLFLISENKAGAFAHLHPISRGGERDFETALPPLPAGRYHLYADITHVTGFAETLTATVEIPAASTTMTKLWLGELSEPICSPIDMKRLTANLALSPDIDDSWLIHSATLNRNDTTHTLESVSTDGSYTLKWENPQMLVADRELSLQFRLKTLTNDSLLEPYMGMLGHAVVRNEDGSVFAHAHPAGTFSMAAQEYFVGTNSAAVGDATASSSAPHSLHTNGAAQSVSFPYVFPKAGKYNIWVQTKSQGKIHTGVFAVDVAANEQR